MARTINEVSIFADGLDHPESIAIHPDQSVWAGGEAGQIYRISADGKEISEIVNTGGFVLGIAFSPDLSWLAICDLKNKCVWKLELKSKTLTALRTNGNDQALITPNFPVFDKKGNLYVSDSGNFRQVNGRIWKFTPDGMGSVWHPGPFSFANGMALNAARDQLLVVCTWLPGVEQVEIDTDGNPGERKILVHIPETCPDGIAIDQKGRVYISCYAPNTIFSFDLNDGLTTVVHDWESHTICNPTNIAFGGHNRQQLYIANLGRWHISTMEMEVPGLPLF